MTVKEFLQNRWDRKRPLLLAFSGGPDSLALLWALLDAGVKPALAHVDHGWREESRQEARMLALYAKELGLPFFLKTLERSDFKGNLEAEGRRLRLQFFREIKGYEAVLMGHHQDDLAETTLKKIFEGAEIFNLSSLKEESLIDGLKIWRPFLKLSKKDVLELVSNKKYIEDSTNLSDKFLRGRMRTLILPFLNENFGKTVTSGLVTLAKRSEELNGYLDEQVKPHFEAIKRGPFGLRWEGSLHPFELKHFLYKLFKAEGIPCRQQSINDLSHWMLEGKRDARLSIGSSIAYVDRGRFFLLKQETGAWRYSFSDSEEMGASSWEHVWEGKAWASLPHSDVELVRQPTSFFHKWWTGHKIPAVLRTKIPIVCEKGVPIHELLTGKYKKTHTPRKKIFLQFDESLAEDTFLC